MNSSLHESSDLQALFEPQSIAIVGASADPAKIGAKPILALEANGYTGRIYPVNPKYETILGLTAFPSVQAIPNPVDLAIISLPAAQVPNAVRECAAAGVKFAVIFSAGFSEAGAAGKQLQQEIKTILQNSSLRLVGPNTAGVVNNTSAMVASFASTFMGPPAHRGDGVAFITQSGAFGVYVYNLAQQSGLGIDYYINTGNEVNLEVGDFIDYLADRPEVRAIALYLEGVRDGERFRQALDKCFDRGLPVVAIKVGRTDAASRAALSHTGALTGSDNVYDAVFQDKGVVRVNGIMEMLDVLALFARHKLPKDNRVGILTTTGGGGVWMADLCREVGLDVPEFVGPTRQALEQELPAFAAASNPADLTGQMYTDRTLFQRTINIMSNDSSIDALVLVSGGNPETVGANVPATIVQAARSSPLPLYVAWVGAPLEFYRMLASEGVPAFDDPVRCAHALGNLARFRSSHAAPKTNVPEIAPGSAAALRANVLAQVDAHGRLTESKAKSVLAQAGIPVSVTQLATGAQAAATIAAELGFPVVLKAESPDLLHRSEANAILLGLGSRSQVLKGYKTVLERARTYAPHAAGLAVSVQPMLPQGIELLAGLSRDPVFGLVLTVGLGGIWTEALRDVSMRVLPVSKNEALEMLRELRGVRLLHGMRGAPPSDLDAVAEILSRLSALGIALGDSLLELDINPIMVYAEGSGAVAADALMVLESASNKTEIPDREASA